MSSDDLLISELPVTVKVKRTGQKSMQQKSLIILPVL